MYRNSKLVRSASLSLRFAPNPKRSDYRLAVVVSRKVSKSAVVRNRIRRRIYEHVRILSTSFSTPRDLMVVVFDESFAEKPAEYVDQEVTKLFIKAKLLTPRTPVRGIVEPNK